MFDTIRKNFIPVKHNIVTKASDRYMLLKKDSLSSRKPNKDFKVTGGHYLLIDGEQVKARHIKQAIRIKTKEKYVYSICTEYWTPILINNLNVFSWNADKWKEHVRRKGIVWFENKANDN